MSTPEIFCENSLKRINRAKSDHPKLVLERVLFKWRQFDGYDFLSGKENTGARYEYRARILTMPGRKRHPSHKRGMLLIVNIILQSFELALLHSGQRLAKLTVFTPRCFTRHSPYGARSQNTGAQTIPFKQDTL